MDDRIEDLGDLLAEGGAVVGGGTAIGYALGWVVASLLRDAGAREVSTPTWARKGGQLGESPAWWRSHCAYSA